MRNALPLVVTLAVIAMVSGAALAYLYQATAPVIAEQKELALKEGILQVVPGASSYTEVADGSAVPASTDGESSVSGLRLFRTADSNGTHTGLAVLAEGVGFQGAIQLMIGIDPQTQAVTGLKVLAQQETPGLGARIAEDWFQDQFQGKSLSDPFVAKQDVDAITGATISSKAVADIVRDTAQSLKPILVQEAN